MIFEYFRGIEEKNFMSTESAQSLAGNGKEIRIHIDQKAYHSPNQTTADALYILGHVKPDLVLY